MTEKEKRKIKSEKLLKKLGSEFLPSLPLIESTAEAKIRTGTEAGQRIICLLCSAAKADGVDHDRLINWLKNESQYLNLSPLEKEFLEKSETSQNDKIKFSWQAECIWLLLWAVNKVKSIMPTKLCNVQEILKIVPNFETSTSDFISSLKLRSKGEILDMSDFLYRAHWATRQHSMDGKTKIGKLNPGIVQEWHYAINWLTCYEEIENWDEITTDT